MPVKGRIVHAWEVIKEFSQHSSRWILDFFTFQLFNETVCEKQSHNSRLYAPKCHSSTAKCSMTQSAAWQTQSYWTSCGEDEIHLVILIAVPKLPSFHHYVLKNSWESITDMVLCELKMLIYESFPIHSLTYCYYPLWLMQFLHSATVRDWWSFATKLYV